jgi:HD-GYP domain-containing protein (c-di-GMP phosphodiesterase class II)
MQYDREPQPRQADAPVLDQARLLEADLKRALYAAYETAGATKAALYLATSNNSEERFELITSYAFSPADRRVVDMKDPLVQRLVNTHDPVTTNGIAEDKRLAEVLFRHNNERMLAVPVMGRGRRMIGFIDLRDKVGRKRFEYADTQAAERIGLEIARILGNKNLYGLGRVPLVDMPRKRQSGAWAAARLPIAKDAAAPAGPSTSRVSTRAFEVIRRARERMAQRDRTLVARRRILTREEFERIRVLLPAVLAVPGVVAGMLTSMTSDELQAIVCHGEMTSHAIAVLQEQLAVWARRAPRDAMSTAPAILPTRKCNAVTAEQIRTVASSQLAARAVERLALTIAFDRVPDDAGRRGIENFVQQMGDAVEALIGRVDVQAQRLAMAERLLEPDFNKYPHLGDHCRAVSMIAQRFAVILGMPKHDAETVRIAALVHDVGLRLIDYDKLSLLKELSEEQTKAVAEHPLVGAALVEPILGSEVALAVLRHHERVDGTGYPSRVAGENIPVASKIIAIADAWVAMTAPWPYIAAKHPGDAAARLRDGAGKQFDASLVETFLANKRQIVDSDDEL